MVRKKAQEQHNDLEDAFIREIDEELKNEKIKKLWDKYGLFIILFVFVAFFSAVSFETFQAWKDKRNQEMSDSFAYALNLQNQGRFAESQEVLTSIKNSNRGIYTNIAQMQIVNLLIELKQFDKAISELEQIVADEAFNPQMRDVARLKLASYKLNTASAEEINALLAPLTDKQNVWNNTAKELLAMRALRDNDPAQALNIYKDISGNSKTTDTLQSRVQDMINVLSQQ